MNKRILVCIPYLEEHEHIIDKVKALYEKRAGYPCTVITIKDVLRNGWVNMQNTIARDHLDEYDFFVYTAVDYFPAREWLKIAVQAYNDTHCGLIGFNDGKWFGDNATAGMIEKNFMLTNYDGSLFYSKYKHHGADPDLTNVAKLKNQYYYEPKAILIEVDYDKDIKSGGSGKTTEDTAIYNQRVQEGFGINKKLIVYTAIFGNIDSLKEQPQFDNVEYHCFTDNEELKSSTWNIRYVPMDESTPRRCARKYKALAHKYFLNSEFTLWIDGSIQLKQDPKNIIALLNNHDIAVTKHKYRSCVYSEADACIMMNKDTESVIKQQVLTYMNEGYPMFNGLAETGVLLRRNCLKTRMFNELWWRQILRKSYRDQISFDYCCWKLDMKYSHIPRRLFELFKHDDGVKDEKNIDNRNG